MKPYKQLRKKLKNKYVKTPGEFMIYSSVGAWVSQCGIKPKPEHLRIICEIFGSVPYVHQEKDRKVILKYLKKNKKFKRNF